MSIHNHTNFSDGKDSIEDTVKRAKEIGLKTIGISDHFSVVGREKHLNPDNIGKHVDEVNRVRKKFPDMEILVGPEVDFPIEDDVSKNEAQLKVLRDIKSHYKIDYYIGSVHAISTKNFYIKGLHSTPPLPAVIRFDNFISVLKHRLFSDYGWYVLNEYWRNMKMIAAEPMFDVIGHPDYIKLLNNETKKGIAANDLKRDFFKLVQQNNKVIEFNTGGYWWFPISFPGLGILGTAIENNIPIIVTSDSHSKRNLTNCFDYANKKLMKLVHKCPSKYQPRSPSNEVLKDLIFNVQYG